jgi:hypothetical protein
MKNAKLIRQRKEQFNEITHELKAYKNQKQLREEVEEVENSIK